MKNLSKKISIININVTKVKSSTKHEIKRERGDEQISVDCLNFSKSKFLNIPFSSQKVTGDNIKDHGLTPQITVSLAIVFSPHSHAI